MTASLIYRLFAAALLLCMFGLQLPAQDYSNESAETLFYEADYWYSEMEEYAEAAYFFRLILQKEPDNANVKFLIGMCYSNIRGSEEEAIPFLQEATQDITLKYKEHKYSIKKAPHHAWYYLADTYRKINELDKALEALQEFSNLKNFEKHYHVRLTEEATKQVERAKIIRDAELNLRALYFKEPINTTNNDYNGVISADGNMMVWASSKTFYEAVYMSTRGEGNSWSEPVEMATQIVSDGNLFPTGLSADGTTLLLRHDPIRGNSDIWYSQYDGMYWSPAQPVHGEINSSANEVHASLSPDGNRMFFVSDRKGGFGELDVWYSDKQADGRWGEAVNMGDMINTEKNEHSAYLAPGEGRFIFASEGHFNMGGYDIFRCDLQDGGSWGEPANMGYPINTTGDDLYFVPLNEGLNGLYSRYTSIGVGMTDLWYVEIQGEDGFVTDGLMLAVDTWEGLSNKDFAVILVDEATGEEIEVLYDAETDSFKALSSKDKTYRVVSYK